MQRLLFLAITLWLQSCSLLSPKPAEILPGKWIVTTATRDGKPTPTLTGLYLEFQQPDLLMTNIAGTPENMKFALDGNRIQQRGGSVDVDFEIVEISEESMQLSTIIYGATFLITFNRQAPQ